MDSIRVLIYEDNVTLRGALEVLIEGSEGYEAVGAVHSVTEALAHYRH